MAHDELTSKLRRDARTTAERLAGAVAQVISDLDDPRRFAVTTAELPGLVHGLAEQCAKLRLLRYLNRDGK